VVSLLGITYPCLTLLLLLGVTTVMLRGPTDGNRTAFRLLVIGTLLSVVADLAFGLILVQTNVRTAAWTDAIYAAMYVLLIGSAELYWRDPVATSVRAEEPSPSAYQLSPLPYLAVVGTYVLLWQSFILRWDDEFGPVAAAAVLITALVVSRQLLAVQQNIGLLADTAARQNEARFRSLVQNASDVIMVVDTSLMIRFVSPSATRVLHYDAERLLGISLQIVLEPDQHAQVDEFMRRVMREPGASAPVEWRFTQPTGTPLHAEIIATNLTHDATLRGIVLNLRDVSERKRLEQQLVHQAFHDPLTGLANRALFRDRVSHAIAVAHRHQKGLAVLFVDLDDFKKVNDGLGHAAGDRLLLAAAERFRSCARAVDTVARLGGDEFAILLEGIIGPEDYSAIIDRLQAAMAQPFALEGNEVFINASLGLAIAGPTDVADDLLRNADVAMYSAKRRGKGRCATFESHMYQDARDRVEMEQALRVALERHQFSASYQPIVALRTGEIVGVEALMRWEHPMLGALTPEQFVPLAEETGLITEMGAWMMREACMQVARWRQAHPNRPLSMAVNVSGRQLVEPDFIELTRSAIDAADIPPAALVLEITESVLMQQTGDVLDQLRQLKKLGVGLAIDDFGTGYSSLSYLQRFPIDTLKIARPFIDELGVDGERAALARAIIGLGQTLHLQAIAEGIEDPAQCAELIELGCTLGQGFYFSHPVSAPEISRLLGQAPFAVPGRLRAI
jgi:diguanylate cyclase (GGDEF)-like protein/PAS domain S-box-containing protein